MRFFTHPISVAHDGISVLAEWTCRHILLCSWPADAESLFHGSWKVLAAEVGCIVSRRVLIVFWDASICSPPHNWSRRASRISFISTCMYTTLTCIFAVFTPRVNRTRMIANGTVCIHRPGEEHPSRPPFMGNSQLSTDLRNAICLHSGDRGS